MKFEDFKQKAIAYLSTAGKVSRKKIHAYVCPENGYSTVKNWLLAMCESGDLERWSDGVSPKSQYLYFLPTVAESAHAELVEDPISNDDTWELVLNALPPFLRPLFKQNAKPYQVGRDTVVEVIPLMLKFIELRQSELQKAIASVFGGNPKDYQVTFVTPAIDFGAEKVEETAAPVVDSIPNEIKSEFSVKPDGSTTVTLSGAARMLGISQQSLTKAFGYNLKRSGIAQDLMGYGFEPTTFGSQGIPDKAFGIIANYYAYEAGRYCTDQAKAVCKAFVGIGVQKWIQHELGWNPQALVKTADSVITENLNALVVSIQGLATSAQSQQAMIHDQQSALREVIAGLNHIGQSIQVHGQKIHEHEGKIIEFDNYIQQQETLRKNAMKSVLGVKPTVEAPPKDPRAQLIHLVNNYVFAKGLGKEGHGKTWAHLYRDIELRCGRSLEVERKKLEANGMKSPKKIDAIESLGLMEIAVAIACEVLEVA